jgi:hypothetical protein
VPEVLAGAEAAVAAGAPVTASRLLVVRARVRCAGPAAAGPAPVGVGAAAGVAVVVGWVDIVIWLAEEGKKW